MMHRCEIGDEERVPLARLNSIAGELGTAEDMNGILRHLLKAATGVKCFEESHLRFGNEFDVLANALWCRRSMLMPPCGVPSSSNSRGLRVSTCKRDSITILRCTSTCIALHTDCVLAASKLVLSCNAVCHPKYLDGLRAVKSLV